MSSKRSTTRKAAAIGLAVVGIAGLTLASAAQLNLGASTLGAATSVVASCQPASPAAPITVSYTNTFAATPTPGYKVSAVGLKAVDAACAGKAVKVSLLGAGDAVLAEVTGTAAAGTATVLTAPPAGIGADSVVKVAVVISD